MRCDNPRRFQNLLRHVARPALNWCACALHKIFFSFHLAPFFFSFSLQASHLILLDPSIAQKSFFRTSALWMGPEGPLHWGVWRVLSDPWLPSLPSWARASHAHSIKISATIQVFNPCMHAPSPMSEERSTLRWGHVQTRTRRENRCPQYCVLV